MKRAAAAGLATSALTDVIDGAIGRRIIKEGGSHDASFGALLDVWSDRTQEAILGIVRAASAASRGDAIGETTAYFATVSNPLPSLVRALVEARGGVTSEGGRDLIGFVGTRAGRTITGVIATMYPDIRGANAQALLDTLTLAANTYTTLTRTHDFFTIEPTLGADNRQKARDRVLLLALTTGTIAGSVLIARKLIHRSEDAQEDVGATKEREDQHYRDTIMRLELAGRSYLDRSHRFVGGILPLRYHRDASGEVVLDTKAKFDFNSRRVYLRDHDPLKLRRASDGTVRDIDMIHFCTDEAAGGKFEHFRHYLITQAEEMGIPHPHVGVEGTFFAGGKKRNRLLQFVTSSYEDELGQQHFVFGDIAVPVPANSLEAWTVVLEGGSLDAQGAVADEFIRQGLDSGINYMALHTAWYQYIHQLQYRQDAPTWIKARATDLYWSTIGESVAHGRWPFGAISRFTTIFTG